MPNRDDGKSMFSRMVRLVATPGREHSVLPDSGSSQFAEAEKIGLDQRQLVEHRRRELATSAPRLERADEALALVVAQRRSGHARLPGDFRNVHQTRLT